MLRRVALQLSSLHERRLSNAFFPQFLSPCHSSPFSSTSSWSPSPPSNFDEHLDGNETPPLSTSKISIDRSGLFNSPEHSHEPSSDSELVKHLKGIIKFRGGLITVAEYMEEVLTNPKAGFYINRHVFGAEGDFITSPEVSQMFGEQMGPPSRVNPVELGPGRGTLVADLLRGVSKFKNFTESLHIHLVECSPTLQKLQYSNLKCVDEASGGGDGDGDTRTIGKLAGSPVSWHAALEEVSSGVPTTFVAHEFYDALPVHQFQRAFRGWCEKMIDVAENSS
ncbi:Protein arginine methyltransferase NDUFAF7 [Dillenia turbinata]|uniref:Protein arginine methyltransferase NDUFAF7 n=1 Tax=Dillenia turbinata TaxID=194707 RepID=A0AAN8Z835_9MAGN